MLRNSSITMTFAILLLASPAVFATAPNTEVNGDPRHGDELYAEQCKGCHELHETLVGPKHCGVFSRRAGSVPDYAYSDVMKQSGFIWDTKHLDDFLKAPISYLNGTNMGYAGLDDAKDRADLIAYLREAMDPAVCSADNGAQ